MFYFFVSGAQRNNIHMIFLIQIMRTDRLLHIYYVDEQFLFFFSQYSRAHAYAVDWMIRPFERVIERNFQSVHMKIHKKGREINLISFR